MNWSSRCTTVAPNNCCVRSGGTTSPVSSRRLHPIRLDGALGDLYLSFGALLSTTGVNHLQDCPGPFGGRIPRLQLRSSPSSPRPSRDQERITRQYAFRRFVATDQDSLSQCPTRARCCERLRWSSVAISCHCHSIQQPCLLRNHTSCVPQHVGSRTCAQDRPNESHGSGRTPSRGHAAF